MPTHRAARIAAAPRNWNYQQHNKTAASDCGVEPPGTIVEECRRAPRGSQPLAAHHIAFAIWPTTTRRAGLLLQLAAGVERAPFSTFRCRPAILQSLLPLCADDANGRYGLGGLRGGHGEAEQVTGEAPKPFGRLQRPIAQTFGATSV